MIKWYVRHLDSFTNGVISDLNDDLGFLYEVPCINLNNKKILTYLWSVPTEKMQVLWNSRHDKPLRFEVFRQIDGGQIRQVREFVRYPAPFPETPKFMRPKKGRPAVVFTARALLAIGKRGLERNGKVKVRVAKASAH